MKSPILLLLLFLYSSSIHAQVSEKEFDFLSETFNNYYKSLIEQRGMDTNTYFKSEYLAGNDPRRISHHLKKYYGHLPDRSIAALVYFHYHDSLFVYLADKERLVKLAQTSVSTSSLASLNELFIRSMRIDEKMYDRGPVSRGATSSRKNLPGVNSDSLMRAASALLLPKQDSILQYTHLVIVPCLNLGAFPFYLLPTKKDKLLVDHLSYTIAPSLIEVEAGCRKNVARLRSSTLGHPVRFVAGKSLLVSNPKFGANEEYKFPQLPGSDSEILASLPMFDTGFNWLKGRTATKKNVMKDFSEYDLMYFATHGVSSSTSPLDSCFLVLAGYDDPFLTSKEILAYHKQPTKMEMVILSACQTGLGKSVDAGIIGLGRSFQIAGADHVIQSLWNVDDAATAFLMTRFFHYLKEPHLFYPAEPLRKAMLDTRKAYGDPSMWASFALFGMPY